jgi:transcriptional regulator with XRE-family HTH domain
LARQKHSVTIPARMDDHRAGAALRAVRIKRGWRQIDVAGRADVARSLISMVERGHLDHISLATLRSIAATLDACVELVVRWRGGDLDRLLNAHHSRFHELVARSFLELPAWAIALEVSFAYFGERGVIDILAWHASTRSLLVVESKTEIVVIQELIGTVDRKHRLAARIARDRGWHARTASSWVIVSGSRTNRRRIAAHEVTLRAAFGADGRIMRRWLNEPAGAVSAHSLWTDVDTRDRRPPIATTRRVRVPRAAADERAQASSSRPDPRGGRSPGHGVGLTSG